MGELLRCWCGIWNIFLSTENKNSFSFAKVSLLLLSTVSVVLLIVMGEDTIDSMGVELGELMGEWEELGVAGEFGEREELARTELNADVEMVEVLKCALVIVGEGVERYGLEV
jgi:hypothetical protein